MQKQIITKPWYKNIPNVWIIPEDWEITSLWKIGETYWWLTWKDKNDFWEWIPYIPYMNIFTNSVIKDDHFDLVKIKEWENQNKVLKWDLFFTTSSETPEEVWMCSSYLWNKEELYLNSFCFGFHINEQEKYSTTYLSSYFRSFLWRRIMYRLAQWATRYNLSKTNLLKTNFWLPPIQEQQKIATVLNICDNQIETTKQIIQKIELRNKWLQLQLLNWKKRLPGFTEKWNTLLLEECLNYSPRPVDKPSENFFALWIRSHWKWIFHKNDFDPEDIAIDILYEVKEDDLIVNITFAWEQAIAIANKKDDGWLVSHRFPTYTFKLNKAIHRYFRYLIIQKRFKYMLDQISPGWAWRNRVLSKKDFLKLEVKIPKVEEQKAIADVLDKATEQLNEYKQILEKLELQKKGLMQQLLTGKTRVKI